jgi:hypothetical protein
MESKKDELTNLVDSCSKVGAEHVIKDLEELFQDQDRLLNSGAMKTVREYVKFLLSLHMCQIKGATQKVIIRELECWNSVKALDIDYCKLSSSGEALVDFLVNMGVFIHSKELIEKIKKGALIMDEVKGSLKDLLSKTGVKT